MQQLLKRSLPVPLFSTQPRWSALRALLRNRSESYETGCIVLPLMCGVSLRMRKCAGSFLFSTNFVIV
jgi:hypothetical protein